MRPGCQGRRGRRAAPHGSCAPPGANPGSPAWERTLYPPLGRSVPLTPEQAKSPDMRARHRPKPGRDRSWRTGRWSRWAHDVASRRAQGHDHAAGRNRQGAARPERAHRHQQGRPLSQAEGRSQRRGHRASQQVDCKHQEPPTAQPACCQGERPPSDRRCRRIDILGPRRSGAIGSERRGLDPTSWQARARAGAHEPLARSGPEAHAGQPVAPPCARRGEGACEATRAASARLSFQARRELSQSASAAPSAAAFFCPGAAPCRAAVGGRPMLGRADQGRRGTASHAGGQPTRR